MAKDPLLENKEKQETEGVSVAFQSGLEELDISYTEIEECARFLKDFLCKVQEDNNKQIFKDSKSMLEGAIFALGTRKENGEWRAHCATSLRELFTRWANRHKNLIIL